VLFVAAGPALAGTITLIYSGNMDGELEPCGCAAETDYGGIKRRATMVDRLRAEQPDLFLISAGGLLVAEGAHDDLKSTYILKGMGMLDYDAIGVQWRDLAFGPDFLAGHRLPLVASNWRDGAAFVPERRIRRAGHTLVFFQWLDPAQSPQRQMHEQGRLVSEHTQDLAAALRRAKADGAVTVLASTLPLDEARTQLPLDDVDVLLIRARYELFGEPQQLGHSLVLQPGSRGMRLGRVDLTVDGAGRVTGWKHQVIPLSESIPDAPRLQAWYDEYNAKVEQDYQRRVALRKAQSAGTSPYVGAEACSACHAAEHGVWQGSKHAGAFKALQAVNKSFDPDCLVCHTVALDQEGGFLDPYLTPNLAGVQCESCHGAGHAHAASQGAKPVGNAGWARERMCAQCHVPRHSPAFEVDQYWPKIAHGVKAAGG